MEIYTTNNSISGLYQVNLEISFFGGDAIKICPIELEIVANDFEWPIDDDGVMHENPPRFVEE